MEPAHPTAETEHKCQAAEFSTQLALVAAGLGVAVVPRPAVGVVTVEPPRSRRIFAVWLAEAARRPSVSAFVDTLGRQWAPRGGR
ncbi:LysR substrate-binding domain-containing protein [Actinophytocola sediminis]